MPVKKGRLGYILSANMARAQRAMAIAMIAPVADGRGKGTLKILSDLDACKTALDRKKEKEWLRGFWRRQVILYRRALAPGVDISIGKTRAHALPRGCWRVLARTSAGFS